MSAKPVSQDPEMEIDDDEYDSEADEDFKLDGQDDEVLSSDSDEEASKKRKAETEDAALDSGDEVTIKKAKSRKEKKRKGNKSKAKGDDEDDLDLDDDEGGPGGFVRTRAMKMQMKEERKPLAKIDGATVDVDALWAKMNERDSGSPAAPSHTEKTDDNMADGERQDTAMREQQAPTEETQQKPQHTDEMIKIKRTYEFAGEMITEEKVVPKDSAEARLFLANEHNPGAVATNAEDDANGIPGIKLRRPLRKVSRFDPNPTGAIKKSWEKQPIDATGQEENARGPKINTVEKSRLDWAAYVDQAGIRDELTVHSRAKEGFLGRMDFLDRVGAKEDEDRRNVRLKGI
ncbi:BCNT-domain-containing protein [Aspergillus campestris IBT 28561]|uniref:SWR1-complex protein 5 n=1 Tax=Aspergillus campestris (strain IBT 28561) TaxID=1392248 RepID=A0A2I1DH91_ASPC2|nr:BCNT-domain-containing protein [Aspergillus campestris IBT 28561]PKY09236.1 BCNT-domain-containing protein [Aspergillus campestris IBT 28561]